jgi:membrane-bound lytic murein transglycosylase C
MRDSGRLRAAGLRAGLGAVSILFLASCTMQQAIDIALSKDPKAALKSLQDSKINNYKSDPRTALTDLKRIDATLQSLFKNLRQESNKKWGEQESAVLPSAKRYVKYTQAYKNRIIVDYEANTIRIEHLKEPQAAAKIRGAIVVALLTPEDPKSADVFTDADVVLDGKPFLQDVVLNQNGKPMKTRADVERFADYLVSRRLRSRNIQVGGGTVAVSYVQFDMIGAEQDRAPNYQPDEKAGERVDPNRYAAADKIAPKFLPVVNKHASETGVDPALIFAIIYQESRFNPNAVSQANAYGMMQLVPASGGLEAFRKVHGVSQQPTQEYLRDPENNIQLGATYLGILLFEQWLKNIQNMPSREYCSISAYNTGPGNVAKALSGSASRLADAQKRANSMRPDELFDHLRNNLPYAETRDYLVRVAAARQHYQQLFYSGASQSAAN